jgi:cytochrome c biogenesis protein CcmG/thiol:disulfide interchange protein DsbE
LRKQIIVAIAVVVLAGLAIFQTSAANKEELPKVGFKAPQISLQGLDGKTYSFETLQGKPVVINFWASWCGPCKLEAPELVRLYEKYKGEVEIYAVNLTSGDDVKNARAFADDYGFQFPVLLDEEGDVADKYQIQAIPSTFFVNNKGTIIYKATGLVSAQTLESQFKQLGTNK